MTHKAFIRSFQDSITHAEAFLSRKERWFLNGKSSVFRFKQALKNTSQSHSFVDRMTMIQQGKAVIVDSADLVLAHFVENMLSKFFDFELSAVPRDALPAYTASSSSP